MTIPWCHYQGIIDRLVPRSSRAVRNGYVPRSLIDKVRAVCANEGDVAKHGLPRFQLWEEDGEEWLHIRAMYKPTGQLAPIHAAERGTNSGSIRYIIIEKVPLRIF